MLNIACSLKNYTPIFLTQVRTVRTQQLEATGFTVLYQEKFDWNKPILKTFSVILWNFLVLRIILMHRISVVHANDSQMVWRTMFAALMMRRKFIASIRGVFEPGKKYGVNRVWVNFCDHIVVMSNEMKAEMTERLPFFNKTKAKDRILVIGSIIGDSLFKTSKNFNIGFNPGFYGNVLVVAAFNPLKNQLVLLQRVGQWFKQRNICIHFVGDFDPKSDSYSKACADVVKELDIASHTVFHGFQGDVQSSYLRADLTLVVSRREGLARCMIESLATGTPVVSFDVCSATEILCDNDCGLVVRQGDYDGLCNGVAKLLGDRLILKRMSENGKAVAADLFRKEEIIGRYERLYSSQ